MSNIILIAILAVGIVIICYAFSKEKKFLLKALASAMCGIGTLGAVNLFCSYTGVFIALNYFSALIAVVFSVPGVIMLLVLRMYFLL